MTSYIDTSPKTRSIDVLLFDDVNLLDVSGPVQAFDTARVNGNRRYDIRYVSLNGRPVRAGCGLRMVPDAALSSESTNDDLLIPGGAGINALIPNSTVCEIVANHLERKPNGRVISICSGALLLAAAGVLDGRLATTHWSRLADIKTYDRVLWDLDQISTAQDRVFTSAGVTTGIDLALSIIRADCGASVALAVARELVVQLRRTGGQSQYAIHLAGQFTKDDALTRLIEQVVAEPYLDWSLDALADTAGMNPRTLSRHFKRDLQENPAQFVERVRVDHARGLMADKLSLKQVARLSGFGDLQRMRRAFQRRYGINVSDYLNTFVE
ncbi:putative transcriptional regulator [Octadecabacter antarcticus 307]|uniref:Putative transcriptional regulator n=1 Tax=Octadecabacter antarcticus 307 TaxID=391626 RepID=M9R751_9RHOB|nr:DJ-1/PfpI family protein [Octadecabacter antarcticus]AGI67598.1 putative transcriptional regulator [Octadecabacter antarcticus 307]